jgi:hypothetical protein
MMLATVDATTSTVREIRVEDRPRQYRIERPG